MYKKEASFRSTVNWICSNGNGKRVSDNKCTARCITKAGGSLKLGQDPYDGPVYVVSKYGTRQLVLKQHTFNRHVSRDEVTYWRCSQFAVLRCRSRVKTKGNILTVLNSEHNHPVITKTRKYGSLKINKSDAVSPQFSTSTGDPLQVDSEVKNE